MKKILLAIALVFGMIGYSHAQTTTPNATGLKKDGTPDMRLKANRAKKNTATVPAQQTPAPAAAPAQTAPTGTARLKKDGTPDMRLKANKAQKAAPAAVQPAPAAPVQSTATRATAVPQSSTQPAARAAAAPRGADPILETDAKGRTIYQGPRGGKYYINKNGHKEYVK